MDQVCKLGNRYFGDNITAGVGKVYDKISDLYLSFKQAEMALEYRVLLKANQAIYIKDIEPKLSTNFQSHDLEINQLIRTIKVGSQEDITKEINQIIQRISAENLSLNQLQNFYIEVWSEVIKLTKIYDILLEELEGLNNSFERFLQTIQSLQDIQQWLLNISIQIRGKLKSDRKNTAQLLMDKAKGFIELNYSDSELSVEKMCEYLGLSATYFSTSSIIVYNQGEHNFQ